MKRYTFYEDPGHGWLEVPMAELEELGIAGLITSCSYMDGDKAYLEEDCDLSTFMAAKILGLKPADWREACAALHGKGDTLREWWKENVEVNDRATLRGACEIFIRQLPSYWANKAAA
jgi:hypothetical protein